jgi:hypothetical protein
MCRFSDAGEDDLAARSGNALLTRSVPSSLKLLSRYWNSSARASNFREGARASNRKGNEAATGRCRVLRVISSSPGEVR